jgi:hypothetical protein
MILDENRPAILDIQPVNADPRHVDIVAKIDALSTRAGEIHDEIARVQLDP